MYNNKLSFIINSSFLKSKKNVFFTFYKTKKKHNYIFKTFKNNKKKFVTNICLHQNKFKTINNFCKMNRHALLFKLTFNRNKQFTKI